MAWFVGILIGAICFSVFRKLPTLLQWIIALFVLFMFI